MKRLVLIGTLLITSSVAIAQERVEGKIIVRFAEGVLQSGPLNTDQLEFVPDDVVRDLRMKGFLKRQGVERMERVFRASKPSQRSVRARNGSSVALAQLHNVMVLELPKGADTRWVMDSLSALPGVVYVEPFRTFESSPRSPSIVEMPAEAASKVTFSPNDPEFLDPVAQKSLRGTGANVTPVWDLTKGDNSIRVCIIDSGIDFNHAELGGGSIPNGKVVSQRLYDDNTTSQDKGTHGTGIAGVIGSYTNNGQGVAGIAGGDAAAGNGGVELGAQRILPPGATNAISVATVAQAITDAPDPALLDCDIANMASPPTNYSSLLEDAFEAASVTGIVYSVAAGNDNQLVQAGTDMSAVPDNFVISVGATDEADQKWPSANQGPLIDISGPGFNARTLRPGQMLNNIGQTSGASAHVSGVVSLLKIFSSQEGIDLHRDDIEGLLQASARKHPNIPFDNAGRHNSVGHGSLDAGKAVEMLQAPYVFQHLNATGGTLGALQKTEFWGNNHECGLPPSPGVGYRVKTFLITKTVSFPPLQSGSVHAWARTQGESTGWSNKVVDCIGEDFAQVVPGTITESSATLTSYVYAATHYVTALGQESDIPDIWLRASPSNINWAYTVLGLPESGGCTGPITETTIGPPAISSVTGAYNITSSGGIFGTADDFTMVYKQCSDDFDVSVKVNSLSGPNVWAKAGIMARESLSNSSKNAYAVQTAYSNAGVGLQTRSSTGGTTVGEWTWGQGLTAPRWVRLKRAGNLFEAFHSTNGTNWTKYKEQSVSMPSQLYVGLAVAATNPSSSASASFSDLSFAGGGAGNPPPQAVMSASPSSGTAPLTVIFDGSNSSDPNGTISDYHWNFGDGTSQNGASLTNPSHVYQAGQWTAILTVTDDQGATDEASFPISVGSGGPGCTGSWTATTLGTPSTSQVTGSYTITSSGGIFGNSDDFTFVYQQCSGDIDIEVEVTSISGPNGWGKGGVMIRDELTANAKNAYGIITTDAAHRVGMQWRSSAGGSTSEDWSWGQTLQVPRWIRLVRGGNLMQTYHKVDGGSWILKRSETVAMTDPVYIGLAVAATSSSGAATAVFENLGLTASSAAANGLSSIEQELPDKSNLEQNRPNPFNPITRIRYSVARGGNVSIRVYDAIGRQVRELVNEYHEPGASEVTFDASSLPSGVYFYRMVTSSDVQTRKMTVLK